jgi:hypothetical protein
MRRGAATVLAYFSVRNFALWRAHPVRPLEKVRRGNARLPLRRDEFLIGKQDRPLVHVVDEHGNV